MSSGSCSEGLSSKCASQCPWLCKVTQTPVVLPQQTPRAALPLARTPSAVRFLALAPARVVPWVTASRCCCPPAFRVTWEFTLLLTFLYASQVYLVSPCFKEEQQPGSSPLRLLRGRPAPGPLPVPGRAAIASQISSPPGSRVLAGLADPHTPLMHAEFQLWV